MGRRTNLCEYTEAFLKCMEPIMKPDFKKFLAYTGMSEQEARDKYTFKSWFD